MDCLFCKIISGDIPCDKVAETEHILAFRDIQPVAKDHILIIPKKHIPDIDTIDTSDAVYFSEMILAASDIAGKLGLSKKGYRLIINNGKGAGQEVFHLHLHLIGGEDNLGPMMLKG